MPKVVSGARPRGSQGETQAASQVQQMFAGIAPRYDLLNHLLSFNVDRGWRRALLNSLREVLANPHAMLLDLCCGTGDVFLDLAEAAAGTVLGADFCHPMLVTACNKAAVRRVAPQLFEGDALALPLGDNSLDAISIAFGFRNLANYPGGLLELRRVLKPGGVLAILEFSHPTGWLVRAGYGFYSRWILPAVGGLVSGSRAAYAYLPESIARFPGAAELAGMMEQSGLRAARFELLAGGIAALHVAQK